MSCNRFEGKVALVTGGASGIGAACVERFLKEGAKVVVADYSDKGQDYVNGLNAGDNALFVKMNVANEDEVKNAFDKAVEKYGTVDFAVANAGIGAQHDTATLSNDDWLKIININLNGVFYTDKYAAQIMLKNGGGCIINMGSIHSHVSREDMAGYAASKGAVKMLTQNMCVSYAKKGIRTNTVCPGYIDTPLLAQIPKEARDYLVSLHPQGRLGQADEVAGAVAFLCSDDAAFVNGSCLMVDGGYTAQ